MKILYVVHQLLPPKHVAGTEIYTSSLARSMQARGHQVELFFTESYADKEQYELSRGTYRGIPYHEAVHNYRHNSFRHTYRDDRMEEIFRGVLDRVQPDIVHFQHLQLHSVGYVDIVKDAGLPLVYTLHEYILMCPRGGQLLRPGLHICPGPEDRACAECTADYPPPADEKDRTAAVRARRTYIQQRLDRVDLFISPSAFLRERFIQAGLIRPDRIIHSDNGFETKSYSRMIIQYSDRLRVGYIGTLADYKGVHVLIEAFAGIDPDKAECNIYGDLNMFPEYGRRLQEMPKPDNVTLMGRFDNAKVGEVLANIDLLVIPSLWYENSPLTIHEAYLAGIPVIASNRGGMAELVEDGVSGLHFRMGDPADLRAKILRCIEEEGLMNELRHGLPQVKTIDEDAWIMEDRYNGLLEA